MFEDHAILTDMKIVLYWSSTTKKIPKFSQNFLSKARTKIFFLIDNY